MSVYEVLESFNFPKGILPANAKGYVLHPNGSFQAFLDGVCNMKVEGLGYQISKSERWEVDILCWTLLSYL
ncbi:hypothetical protein SUGI_0286510 [Cryptomeria japonica]|nr:hypothetical protein SUGI_0286510 [Cryptomeria japonica]